ncbi:MAG: hypothetical protein ACLFPD_00995 [Desulfosudaceae bacterium]
MGKIVDNFIWLCIGILGAHVGHYLYQNQFADRMAGASLSEALAMLFENLLLGFIRLLDNLLPLILAYKLWLLLGLGLIVVIIVVFILLKIFMRIRSNQTYNRKIKEAENIVAEAKTRAEEQREESKELREKLLADFEKKEAALQEKIDEQVAQYKVRIKKLEKERLELKETAAGLMRRLKQQK